MPLNGSDVASKPANTTAVPNTTIESAKFNSVVDDIYAIFNTVRSVAKGFTGASTPAGARTNLELDKKVVYSSKSGDYSAAVSDNNATIRFTAAATLSLASASSLGNGWHVTISAGGGDVTIDPNGSETIDGATTVTLLKGHSLTLICDGTGFFVVGANDPDYIGRVLPQNGTVDPGFLRFGEGGSYSRASYPDLAAWMDANGTTAFGLTSTDVSNGVLPDWRDYVPRTAGGSLGPAVGATQQDAAQRIQGSVGTFVATAAASPASSGALTHTIVGQAADGGTNLRNEVSVSFDNANSSGARTATETRVKSVGVRWQIKAKRTY